MSAQPAPQRGLTLAATLRNLWGLIGHAGPDGKRLVYASVAISAFAATIDAASLALLRRTLGEGAVAESAGLQAAAAFLLAALAASVVRLVAQRRIVAAQFAIGNALAVRAFRALQEQDYDEFMRRGASEGFATFDRLQTLTYFGLNQLISGLAALLSALVILVGIGLLYPVAGALMGLALVGIAIETAWRGRASASIGLSDLSRARSLILYEARTGFRHIFLANGQDRMCADFAEAEARVRGAQARATIEGQSSRHTIEIAGLLTALAALGLTALYPLPGTTLVPLLAVIALATFRLLPQVATLRSAFRLIALHTDVTDDVRRLVDQPAGPSASAPPPGVLLERAITLEAITLTRPDRPTTLAGLDLTIARGERIGIRGDSGIGKSSLLDLICGAVPPGAGIVRIDDIILDSAAGRAWRERTGMVSQNPVLLGATLREALVFPEHPEGADPERLEAALAATGIAAMVAGFPRGLDTPVGEASSLLSGGQRQRVSLAHALYRARDLLVLDEATGQLDPGSEAAIVAAVQALPRDLTIIVASHRPAVFACCDIVYRIEGGRLVKDG